MTTRVDVEEMEVTRSEKLLAVVLGVFMLIGGLWAYHNVDEIGRPEISRPAAAIAPDDRAALAESDVAERRLSAATHEQNVALQSLEIRREAYRTALEAGQPTATLEQAYTDAQARYRQAGQAVQETQADLEATRPAAEAARTRIQEAQRDAFDRRQDEERAHDRETFALRLLIVLAGLGAGYWSLSALRRRRSRAVLVTMAGIGASTVLALYLAIDYLTDYFEITDLGPLVPSLVGIALTLIALAALQRYLRRRMPLRRVCRGECPFCGFPVREARHCEGCGRRVIGECSTCHAQRRVGAEHCGACGAA